MNAHTSWLRAHVDQVNSDNNSIYQQWKMQNGVGLGKSGGAADASAQSAWGNPWGKVYDKNYDQLYKANDALHTDSAAWKSETDATAKAVLAAKVSDDEDAVNRLLSAKNRMETVAPPQGKQTPRSANFANPQGVAAPAKASTQPAPSNLITGPNGVAVDKTTGRLYKNGQPTRSLYQNGSAAINGYSNRQFTDRQRPCVGAGTCQPE